MIQFREFIVPLYPEDLEVPASGRLVASCQDVADEAAASAALDAAGEALAAADCLCAALLAPAAFDPLYSLIK